MSYVCRHYDCKKEFEKPSYRNRHEKDAHGKPTSYRVGSKTGLTERHAYQESMGIFEINPEFKGKQ